VYGIFCFSCGIANSRDVATDQTGVLIKFLTNPRKKGAYVLCLDWDSAP